MNELEIIVSTKVYPSEDINKVIKAVKNVIKEDIKKDDNNIFLISRDKEVLDHIYNTFRERKVLGVLRRKLLENMRGDTTWFYLNKQAAYINILVICDDPKESPLGPIKVEIRSSNINAIIESLTRF